MTIEELAILVSRMRTSQKDYFRTRSDSDLKEAKAIESRVDKAVQEILDNRQGKLF